MDESFNNVVELPWIICWSLRAIVVQVYDIHMTVDGCYMLALAIAIVLVEKLQSARLPACLLSLFIYLLNISPPSSPHHHHCIVTGIRQ